MHIRKIITLAMGLIVSSAFIYYLLSVDISEKAEESNLDISKLIVGEWVDNRGIRSIFFDDMTMVYRDSGEYVIKGKYEFANESTIIWTLQRPHITADTIIWRYAIIDVNKVTIEEIYYNEFDELVSYKNPILELTRIN